MTAGQPPAPRPRVVIIGSGFGGLFAAQRLRKAPVDVTLVAKTTHHLFQPLLYQVATGILSEGEIAPPTREVLASHKNTRVLLGEVTDIDLANREWTVHILDADSDAAITREIENVQKLERQMIAIFEGGR